MSDEEAESPVEETVQTTAATSSSHESVNRVYRLVLTGGPCGGKTTGMVHVANFFEEHGWKVFSVPECATILLGGGVRFPELNAAQSYQFQKDLLLTLIRIETTFFNQARMIKDKNVLIICDRGAMDPSAYVTKESWRKMLDELDLDEGVLRDDRYDQIVHMVTAADGAEKFYTLSNNNTRKEGIDAAKNVDWNTRHAWVGHPTVSIIDNSDCRKFDDKINKLLQVVCDRAGLETYERLAKNSRKRKWLLASFDEKAFETITKYEEFKIKHDYLPEDNGRQLRVRSRSQHKLNMYTLTSRVITNGEIIETRKILSKHEYETVLKLRDPTRVSIHKVRRCFAWGNHFYSLDKFVEPLPPTCPKDGLIFLETYTTFPKFSPEPALPPFVKVVAEVTHQKKYSMYNLSRATPTVEA